MPNFKNDIVQAKVIQFQKTPQPFKGSDGGVWFDNTSNGLKILINGQPSALGGIASVSSLPATCTPGVTSPVQLSVTPFGIYFCSATNTWSRSSVPNNVIDVTSFGAKFDGKVVYGNSSSIVITNGSPTITCSTCNFTASDVGKQFTATSGGVGGVAALYTGIFAIPNLSTTILTVNSPTSITISRNATQSCTTGCEIAWASNDDIAISAAETAWQALPTCGTIILPSGITAILKSHFNNPGTNCTNETTNIDFNALILGQGQGSTQIGLFAGFDSTTCTGGLSSDVCFFGYNQAILNGLAFNGFGAGNTGFSSAKKLIGPGLGAQVSNLACNGFGGSDSNLTGFSFNGTGVRATFLSIDGCGNFGGAVNGGIAKCYYCFFGDTLGANLTINSGGDIEDFGSDYGVSGTTVVINVGSSGTYKGIASGLFSQAVNNSSAIFNSGTTELYGGKWNDVCATDCNGVFMNGASSVLRMQGTQVQGKGVGGSIAGSAGKFYDLGGNTFNSPATFTGSTFGAASITGTLDVGGNHVLTSGWGTANINTVTGATTDVVFTISVTGGVPTASPVLTDTFANSFISTPGGGCSLIQIGGTFGSISNPAASALTKTGVTWTFTGTPVSGQSYTFQRHCGN